jgi:hypothetical protein
MPVYVWRIYCNTENIWNTQYSESSTFVPSVCINNTSHEVNPNSQQLLNTIGNIDKVEIVQDAETTQGLFKREGGKMVLSIGDETKTAQFSWKMNISCIGVGFYPQSANIGDKISLIVAPNTPLGVLTQNANIGDTVLNISSPILGTFLKLGYTVLSGTTEIGYVANIDVNTSQITLHTPLTINISQGSVIRFQIYMIKDEYIATENPIEISRKSVKSTYLPKNTQVHLVYHNTNNMAKNFYYYVDFLY